MKGFEEKVSRFYEVRRIDGAYAINGDISSCNKLLCFMPYCLKKVNCAYRTKQSCDLSQGICDDCVVKKILLFFREKSILVYQIVHDIPDMEEAVKDYISRNGMFDGVVAITCPMGFIGDMHYIERYPVPVLFLPISGWTNCRYKKGRKGKWWGETDFDIDILHRVWEKCFGTSPSTGQQDR